MTDQLDADNLVWSTSLGPIIAMTILNGEGQTVVLCGTCRDTENQWEEGKLWCFGCSRYIFEDGDWVPALPQAQPS